MRWLFAPMWRLWHIALRSDVPDERAAGLVASLRTPPIPTPWDVFDSTGRWLCTVTMPAGFTPLDIGNDDVAGLARDADDVEYVRLYRLLKP